MDHLVDAQVAVIGLAHEFKGRVDVTQCTGGIRTSAGDEVSILSLGPETLGSRRQCRLHVGTARIALYGCTMQAIEQHVAIVLVVALADTGAILEQDVAGDTEAGSKRRRLSGMIRLGGTLGEDNIGILHVRLSHQELELAGLVAAGGHTSAVVALDPDTRTTEFTTEILQKFQRCWQVAPVQAGKTGKVHNYWSGGECCSENLTAYSILPPVLVAAIGP